MKSPRRSIDCLISLSLSLALLAPAALAKGKGAWEEHIESGRQALQSGDFDSADSFMKLAMEDTRKFKDDDVRLGTTYFEMGELNVHLQHYSLAKEYYERAQAVQQKLLGAESLEAANSLYGIALCNQQMGDHLAAEIFLKRVHEIWRKKLAARDPKLVSILPSMAAYAAMKNNFASAESYYRQLVDLAEASGNQAQLGNYLNLLSTTLGNESKFDEAKDYATRAVVLLKKSSESSIAIDSAEDNLRIIQRKTGAEKAVTAENASELARQAKQQEQDRLAAEKSQQAEKARIAAESSRHQAEATRLAAEQARAAEQSRLAAEHARAAEQARIAAEQANCQAEQARIAAEKAKTEEQNKLAAAEQAKIAEQARLASQRAKAAEQAKLAADEEARIAKLAAAEAKKQSDQKQAELLQERVRIAQDDKQQADRAKSGQDTGPKPWQTDRAIKKPDSGQSQWGKVRYLSEGRLISAEEYKALLLANEAYDAMRQEKYRMAVDILTKALDMCPELPSAHTNIGLALARVGRPEDAIDHLKTAIALDPSRSAPWVNLASSFQTTGRLKDCVETYKEYLRRFPDDALAVKARDLVKHLQGEADEQDEVEKAIASAKGSQTNDYFPFTTASGTIKWPEAKIPVKVYIGSGAHVPGYKSEDQGIMSDSFKSWSNASQDKIKFDFVNSAEKADIACIWTNDYTQVSSPSEGGEAQVQWSADGIQHVKIVILTADPTPDSPLTTNQVQAVCLHEIGHSIGLIGHSPKPSDIMFCSMPSADSKVALSPRDIGTIRHLYTSDVQIAIKPSVKHAIDPSDKNSVNNEGVELMTSHAYAQAIEKFETALKIDPNYEIAKENLSSAYNNYALDLINKGKDQEAETFMQKAMKLQSSIRSAAMKLKITTMHNYALVLRKLHREAEATKVEADAKALDPKEASH